MHVDTSMKFLLASREGSDVDRFNALARVAVENSVPDAEAVSEIQSVLIAYPPKGSQPAVAEIIAYIRSAEGYYRRGAKVSVTNYFTTPSKFTGKPTKEPVTLASVIEQTVNAAPGIFRVDNVLCVDDPQHGFHTFDRHGSGGYMGFLRSKANVDFAKGGKFVSANELFAEACRTAPKFDGIEAYPHEPPVQGIYYRCTTPEPGSGEYLKKYLDFFRPATTVDRDLIQAELMTMLWGGSAGSRPMFVHDSDDGRGAGKTKLAEKNARLFGGAIEISPNEDMGVIKQRLLSPGAATTRVLVVDNIKSLNFSWAELEALLTSSEISGKRLYVGEGRRPNLLTYIATLNNASLSTDLAQRSVIIKVCKGDNAGPWDEHVNEFIDTYRNEIISDLVAALRAEPHHLAKNTRWAAWEAGVLCRLPDPEAAQRLILERQHAADVEQEGASIVEQYFADQLAAHGFDPMTVQIRIPVAMAAEWYASATGERAKTTAASRRLHQMAREGQLTRIAADPSRTHGRCFIWTGQDADFLNDPINNTLVATPALIK